VRHSRGRSSLGGRNLAWEFNKCVLWLITKKKGESTGCMKEGWWWCADGAAPRPRLSAKWDGESLNGTGGAKGKRPAPFKFELLKKSGQSHQGREVEWTEVSVAVSQEKLELLEGVKHWCRLEDPREKDGRVKQWTFKDVTN